MESLRQALRFLESTLTETELRHDDGDGAGEGAASPTLQEVAAAQHAAQRAARREAAKYVAASFCACGWLMETWLQRAWGPVEAPGLRMALARDPQTEKIRYETDLNVDMLRALAKAWIRQGSAWDPQGVPCEAARNRGREASSSTHGRPGECQHCERRQQAG